MTQKCKTKIIVLQTNNDKRVSNIDPQLCKFFDGVKTICFWGFSCKSSSKSDPVSKTLRRCFNFTFRVRFMDELWTHHGILTASRVHNAMIVFFPKFQVLSKAMGWLDGFPNWRRPHLSYNWKTTLNFSNERWTNFCFVIERKHTKKLNGTWPQFFLKMEDDLKVYWKGRKPQISNMDMVSKRYSLYGKWVVFLA